MIASVPLSLSSFGDVLAGLARRRPCSRCRRRRSWASSPGCRSRTGRPGSRFAAFSSTGLSRSESRRGDDERVDVLGEQVLDEVDLLDDLRVGAGRLGEHLGAVALRARLGALLGVDPVLLVERLGDEADAASSPESPRQLAAARGGAAARERGDASAQRARRPVAPRRRRRSSRRASRASPWSAPPRRRSGPGAARRRGRRPRSRARGCARSRSPTMPCSVASRISRSTLPASRAPSADVGSSRITIRLPNAIARAHATAWRWPPDSRPISAVAVGQLDLQAVDQLVGLACASRGRRPSRTARATAAACARGPAKKLPTAAGVVEQREVLVDGLDPQLAGVRAASRCRTASPSIRISPSSGSIDAGEDLDQRRLAGAVVAEQREHLALVAARARRRAARSSRRTACAGPRPRGRRSSRPLSSRAGSSGSAPRAGAAARRARPPRRRSRRSRSAARRR